MKPLYIFVLALAVATTATAPAQFPTFTWQANPGWSAWPPCTTKVTTMCRTGFAISDVTKPSAPFNVSNTISATALSYTMWKMPTVGIHTFSLVANAKNQAGAATASTPVTLTTTIKAAAAPGAPLAFAIKTP